MSHKRAKIKAGKYRISKKGNNKKNMDQSQYFSGQHMQARMSKSMSRRRVPLTDFCLCSSGRSEGA